MKTKNIALIFLIMIFSLSIQAQFSIGIRAGISSTNIKTKDFVSDDYKLNYSRGGNFGYHFGVISQIKISKFFIQPELLFTTSKIDISVTKTTGTVDSIHYGKQVFRKLDLPVMVGVKIRAIKLQAGPVASLLINSKSDLLNENNIDQKLKTATIGYQVGFGLELGSLLVDVKYEGNLSKFGSGMDFGDSHVNFDQRMSQIILSVGYLF